MDPLKWRPFLISLHAFQALTGPGFPDFRNVLIKALVQVWRARENEKKSSPVRPFHFWYPISIFSVGPSKSDDLRDIRDLAMIWVGFETLLRNVEIEGLKPAT
jgi:hypothetical protein